MPTIRILSQPTDPRDPPDRWEFDAAESAADQVARQCSKWFGLAWVRRGCRCRWFKGGEEMKIEIKNIPETPGEFQAEFTDVDDISVPSGSSPSEAVGNLVLAYPEKFGVEIDMFNDGIKFAEVR